MSKAKSNAAGSLLDRYARADLWNADERRARERDAKKTAVLLTAADMFLSHGSHRVSMTDIAGQLGITKPALYNYFSCKDEILFECFRQSNDLIVRELAAIEGSPDRSGLERLRDFIRAYARLVATDYGAVMVRLDDRDLPMEMRNQVRRFKREIDSRVRAVVKQGITDRSIANCDPKMVTFAVVGALNWIGQWFRTDGPSDAEKIGEEFAQLLTEGFANSGQEGRSAD